MSGPGRILLAILLTVSVAGTARAAIDVIDLHHRTAAQLMPSLEGVVDGVVLRPDGFRLIVRGSEAQIDAVRSLVERLDTARASLRISVRRTSGGQSDARGASASVGVDSSGHVAGRARVHSSSDAESRGQTQTVRAVAGRPVFIDTGGVLLLQDEYVAGGRRGRGAYGSRVHPMAAPDGFYATAAVSGEEVTVDISVDSLAQTPNAQGALDRRNVATRVRGRLGEWIPVGSVSRQSDSTGRGIVRRSSDADASSLVLELKVERARGP